MAQTALEAYGRIDILVNNAARWTVKLFKDMTPRDYDADIRVTLYGTLYCSRAVMDAMIGQKYGRIVNLISDAGRIGEPYLSVYSAAKGGVIALTRSLARELASRRVRVNCVCPGPTETEILAENTADPAHSARIERMIRLIPLRRVARPEEIAEAVAFFCTDASRYITGQVLSVSGGLTMV